MKKPIASLELVLSSQVGKSGVSRLILIHGRGQKLDAFTPIEDFLRAAGGCVVLSKDRPGKGVSYSVVSPDKFQESVLTQAAADKESYGAVFASTPAAAIASGMLAQGVVKNYVTHGRA